MWVIDALAAGLADRRATLWSSLVGLVGVLVAAALLALMGQLGVAGRF